MKRRIALAMLLALGIALIGTTGASAVDNPNVQFSIDKTIYTGDFFAYPGGTIPYRYAVTSNEPFVNVVVTDNKCSPVLPVLAADNIHNIGDANLNNVLNGGAGEIWRFKCDDPAPPITSPTLVNTGTVTANLGTEAGPQYTRTDTTTLYGFTLRKQVGRTTTGPTLTSMGSPTTRRSRCRCTSARATHSCVSSRTRSQFPSSHPSTSGSRVGPGSSSR
jgi:hypothetical protein